MIRVAAGIIVHEGKVLIARRKQGQNHGGLWEFPGGKIEVNETPQECLVRELHEELGIEVEAGRIVAEAWDRSGHGSFVILAVEAGLVSGSIRPTVHDEVKWVSWEDLPAYPLAPADRELLEKIRAGLTDSPA